MLDQAIKNPTHEQIELAEKLWKLMEEMKSIVKKKRGVCDLLETARSQGNMSDPQDYSAHEKTTKVHRNLTSEIDDYKEVYVAALYFLRKTGVCSNCRGRGRILAHDCDVCHGTGWSPNK